MKQGFKKVLAAAVSVAMCVSMLPAQELKTVSAAEVTFTEEQEVVVTSYGEERTTNINDGWKFYLGTSSSAQNPDFNDSSWESVDLPHDFSIIQEFTTDGEAESGFLPGGTGWYRKSFVLPESCDGQRVVLNFDGVYAHATVYVNGTKVGENHYGYTPFSFDITDYITCDGSTQNVIAVEAVNNIPSSRWYSGSGIYRDVELIVTDPVHVAQDGTYVTTPNLADSDGADGTVNVAVDVQNDSSISASVTVRNSVYEKDGTEAVAVAETSAQVGAGETVTVESQPAVTNPKLWSTDEPNLYFVRTEIIQDGTVVDSYDTEFGFKWYAFVSGIGFQLNGENVKLNGVSMHHDQGALGSAAYTDAMYRQLTILKDMGVNLIRATHNPYDEDFIDICNELGIMVIEEAFDGWAWPKNGNSYDFSQYFNVNLTDDNEIIGGDSSMTWAEFAIKAMVKRDRNDASIILWSLGNEIQEGTSNSSSWDWGSIADNLIEWVQEVDDSHPLTSGSNQRDTTGTVSSVMRKIVESGGVAGYNYATTSQLESLASVYGGVVLSSETASAVTSRGIYVSQASNQQVDGAMHLTSYDTSTVGWGKTAHASMWDTLTNDYIAGECVWTGFDYIGEPTPYNGTGTGSVSGQGAVPNSSYFGIVDTAGNPKDTYYLYRSQWNQDENTLHLVTAWDSDNMMTTSGKTPVWIYTNAAKVELYRDDTLIGTATRTVNTTDAGHVYYTYTTESNDSSICTTTSGTGSTSLYCVFNVEFTEGTISAKAYDEDGNDITDTCGGTNSVSTPGEPGQLVISQDKTEIQADGSSLVYISVDVTDAEGNFDTTADNDITFTLEGDGVIMGVDNGDQATLDKFQQPSVLTSTTSAHIEAFSGKALVIVKSTTNAGSITVNVSSDGLTGGSVTVKTTAVEGESTSGIASYSMSQHCYVPVGTGSISLPASATVTYSDGSTATLPISWDSYDSANLTKAGSFKVSGQLGTGDDSITVDMTIHVYNPIVGAQNYSGITAENTLPTLPTSLMTYMSDGNEFEEFPVTWDTDGITADQFTEGATVTINGTVTALGESYPVTATIRVAEPVYGESTNIAPQASSLTSNATGDTLSSITNGVKYAASDDQSERWSNWPQRADSDDATITLAWDTAHLIDEIRLYYYLEDGTDSSQAPTSVTIEYSLDGTNFVEIGYEDPTELDTIEGEEENGYSFKLTSSVNPIAIRISLGHDAGYFIGLTEVEVMSTSVSYEEYSSADLNSVTIEGITVELGDATEYTVDAYSIDDIVIGNDVNASVTIVKVSASEAKLVVVSEDGSTTKTYTIILSGAAKVEEARDELSSQLSAASAIDSSLYTAESYAKFQETVAAIESAMASATTEEELQTLMNQLSAAKASLVTKGTAASTPSTSTPTQQTDTESAIKAGDTVMLKKIQYKVLDASAKTVAVVKGTNKKATSVTIPATVTVNGVSCKVVQVGANAFKGYTKLKSVVIGKNVTSVAKKAFYGCTKLSKVTFKGASVKTIKSGAFKKTSSKITVKVPKSIKKNKKTLAAFKKKLTKAGMSKKLTVK